MEMGFGRVPEYKGKFSCLHEKFHHVRELKSIAAVCLSVWNFWNFNIYI